MPFGLVLGHLLCALDLIVHTQCGHLMAYVLHSMSLLTTKARLQVAKVDTIELSQDELYSSRVKDFELRGRQTHPRSEGTDYARGLNSTQWKLLGHFRAAKMKGTQVCASPTMFHPESNWWHESQQLPVPVLRGPYRVCLPPL